MSNERKDWELETVKELIRISIHAYENGVPPDTILKVLIHSYRNMIGE